MDKQTDRWINRQIDRYTYRWIDRKICKYFDVHLVVPTLYPGLNQSLLKDLSISNYVMNSLRLTEYTKWGLDVGCISR